MEAKYTMCPNSKAISGLRHRVTRCIGRVPLIVVTASGTQPEGTKLSAGVRVIRNQVISTVWLTAAAPDHPINFDEAT